MSCCVEKLPLLKVNYELCEIVNFAIHFTDEDLEDVGDLGPMFSPPGSAAVVVITCLLHV